jgi:hypothetical protein
MWSSEGSGGMSDGAFDVFAQPQAVGEQFGQDQDGEPNSSAPPMGGRTCPRFLRPGHAGLLGHLLQGASAAAMVTGSADHQRSTPVTAPEASVP